MGVTGIGGFFFRAQDPKGLGAWYADNLGVGAGDWGMWEEQAGTSVFMPFDTDSQDIPAGKEWRINFRVEGLDDLIAALRGNGIEVTTNPDWDAPGVGRFARLHDPEGNAIELWQPD